MKMNEKGFTLTETVIVLALIVLIIGTIIPGVSYFQNKRTEMTTVELNKMVDQAYITYYAMTGEYPSDTLYSSSGLSSDISDQNANEILQRIFDVTGIHLQKEYLHKNHKMNVNVINKYVVKVSFENR